MDGVRLVYDESKFDPSQVRNMLGIGEVKTRINLPPMEQLRLAGLLRRTGNITDDELKNLNMRAIKICPVR